MIFSAGPSFRFGVLLQFLHTHRQRDMVAMETVLTLTGLTCRALAAQTASARDSYTVCVCALILTVISYSYITDLLCPNCDPCLFGRSLVCVCVLFKVLFFL